MREELLLCVLEAGLGGDGDDRIHTRLMRGRGRWLYNRHACTCQPDLLTSQRGGGAFLRFPCGLFCTRPGLSLSTYNNKAHLELSPLGLKVGLNFSPTLQSGP